MPEEKKKETQADSKKLLKMKALVTATSTTKATILHYVQQGLIPEPIRTSHNMAYYDPSSVKLIKFIKYLQSRYRLSLAEIKDIMKEKSAGRNALPFMEMQELIFGKHEIQSMDQKEFCEKSGLTEPEVKRCIKADILIPKKEGRFDENDVVIAHMLRAGFDAGMSLEEFLYYPRLANELVEAEMAVQAKLLKGQSFNDAVTITMDLVSNARALRSYVIERLFQRRAAKQNNFFTDEDQAEKEEQ